MQQLNGVRCALKCSFNCLNQHHLIFLHDNNLLLFFVIARDTSYLGLDGWYPGEEFHCTQNEITGRNAIGVCTVHCATIEAIKVN